MRGFLLIDLLLAIAFFAIIGTIAAQVSYVSIQSNTNAARTDTAVRLAREALERARSMTYADWYTIANAPRNTTVYATSTAGVWHMVSGQETVRLHNVDYQRSITIASTSRDFINKGILASYDATHRDPSTLTVTANVDISGDRVVSLTENITRWRNTICAHTDWGNGTTTNTVAVTCGDTTFSDVVVYPTGHLDTTGGSMRLAP